MRGKGLPATASTCPPRPSSGGARWLPQHHCGGFRRAACPRRLGVTDVLCMHNATAPALP
jgi:hypothetical protein